MFNSFRLSGRGIFIVLYNKTADCSKNNDKKTEDTVEIQNKVQANEEDGDSTKEAVKEESHVEAPQVQNEAETEPTENEKTEAKSTQDKDDTDSEPESTDESEEGNKTKS